MIALAALLAAAATAIAFLAAFRALHRGLARYRCRYGIDSARDLREALPLLGRGEVTTLALTFALFGGSAGAWSAGVAGALLAGSLGLALPPLLVAWLRARRIRRFEGQLVDALETAAAGLQAGLSLLQALEGAVAESEAPFRDEFGLALREIRLGATPETALRELAGRIASEELLIFVAGTSLARQVGGNLGNSYRVLADALRERFRVEGRLRALSAQGRLQGIVVGAMPLLLALVMHRIRPDLVEPMLAHPFGWALVAAVLLLEAVGFLWIRRLLTPAF